MRSIRSLVTLAALVGTVVLVSALTTSTAARKDKAALLLYGGMLDSPHLMPRADTANLVQIVLLNIWGDSVPLAELEGRPCFAMALFTRAEWASVVQSASSPAEIEPERARHRVRFFPAIGDRPAVVDDPLGSATAVVARPAARVSPGAEHLAKVTWLPVRVGPESSTRCVERP